MYRLIIRRNSFVPYSLCFHFEIDYRTPLFFHHGYRIHRGTTSDFTPTAANLIADKDVDAEEHVDTTAPADMISYYKVVAYNASNDSFPSAPANATTIPLEKANSAMALRFSASGIWRSLVRPA